MEEATRDLMPEIPFASVRSFRNRLVHAYFSVDPDIVWSIAASGLPAVAAGRVRSNHNGR